MARQTRAGCRTPIQALSIPAITEPIVVNGLGGFDTEQGFRVPCCGGRLTAHPAYPSKIGEDTDHGLSRVIQLFTQHPGLVALALDGPTGPYHRIRSGAIYLSAHKGVRLVPIGVASQRKLTLTCRWDRQQIPFPGSRVALAVGDMIDLASLRDAAGQDPAQAIVQRGMDLAAREAESILAAMKARSSSP